MPWTDVRFFLDAGGRAPVVDWAHEIHELRIRRGRVQYRILYFFAERNVAVLLHALKKERRIPPAELARALARKEAYRIDGTRHTYFEETE